MRGIIACLKLALFMFWCVITIPAQLIILLFTKGSAAYVLPQLWHKAVCWTFRISVEVEGTPERDNQVIFVSNHLSYLDIPVIASMLPVSFVAKKEVASWPLFGLLAKLQQTYFIDRSISALRKEEGQLKHRLNDGKSLIIFPEGTSSDGQSVLPFKSSLFGIVLDAKNPPDIQPFTIELAMVNNHEVSSQEDRDLYTWHGDMTLAPHLWHFAKNKGAKVKLHFHDLIRVKEYSSRKDLAQISYNSVAKSELETEILEAKAV